MPSWLRPPRGPYGDVTVPLTGVEIVAELHDPPAGACVVGASSAWCSRAARRSRRRRRSCRHRCRPELPARCPPAGASARPSPAPAAAHSSRRGTPRSRPPPRTARTTCWGRRCRPRRGWPRAGTCAPPRPSAVRRPRRRPRRAWSGRERRGRPGCQRAAAARPHGSRSPCWRVTPRQPPRSRRLKPGQPRWARPARQPQPWREQPIGASCGCSRAEPSAAVHACGVTGRASGSRAQA